MKKQNNKEVWFVTGSQHLYGPKTLKQVAADSVKIAASLDKSAEIIQKIVFKPVLTTPESVFELCSEANNSESCIGLIAWMHTFSPAKMWIRGLSVLNKPFLHLHTQVNRDIPWETIDMDFMNLNQSAHGDREFGFISTRMRLNRKVVVGHYLDPESVHRIAVWVRVATAYDDARSMKVARFGDNMRDVTVTEGNKVSAQIKMGYSVYGYGTGDLVRAVNDVSPNAIKKLLTEYASEYKMTKAVAGSETLREAARIELGNRFRMIVNVVEVVKCPDMPQLPVASVLWKPMPDLKTGAAAWILAGGAHHTGFSTAINAEYLEDFSEMMGIEFVIINEKCNLTTLKNELRWNEVYYHLAGGIN